MIMPFAQENTRKYYADNRELAEDIAAGYKKFIADIYAAGCRDLQFDDCSWGMLVDPLACTLFDTDEKGLKAIKEQLLELNNMAIAGKPDGLVIKPMSAAAISTALMQARAHMTALRRRCSRARTWARITLNSTMRAAAALRRWPLSVATRRSCSVW